MVAIFSLVSQATSGKVFLMVYISFINLTVMIRRSKGVDIRAACGQLREEVQKKTIINRCTDGI